MGCLTRPLLVILILSLIVGLSGCIDDDSGLADDELENDVIHIYERNYVDTIYGNWDPLPTELNRMLKEDVSALKDLGVNLISISVEYRLNEDGNPYTWVDEGLYLENLSLAKENGFAVLLAPNFVFTGDMDLDEMGIDIGLDEYLEMSKNVAIRWAGISEKYGVEIFSPQNEFDSALSKPGGRDKKRFYRESYGQARKHQGVGRFHWIRYYRGDNNTHGDAPQGLQGAH